MSLKADDLTIQAQDLLVSAHELGVKASENEAKASATDFKTDQIVAECYRKQRDVQALRLKKFDLSSAGSSKPNDTNALDTQIAEAAKIASGCWTKMQQGRVESAHLRVEGTHFRAESSKSELKAIDTFVEANQLRNEADEVNAKATALDQKN